MPPAAHSLNVFGVFQYLQKRFFGQEQTKKYSLVFYVPTKEGKIDLFSVKIFMWKIFPENNLHQNECSVKRAVIVFPQSPRMEDQHSCG